MYDELVKALRETDFGDVCVLCESELCRGKDCVIIQAADAIEELQKCLDGVSADNDSLCATIDELERDLKRSKEYEAFWEKGANEALKKFQTTVAKIPRWSPVTEQLPEEAGKYLVCGRWRGEQTEIWVCEFMALGCLKGWANKAANPPVSHWMPLPPAPKEESNGV